MGVSNLSFSTDLNFSIYLFGMSSAHVSSLLDHTAQIFNAYTTDIDKRLWKEPFGLPNRVLAQDAARSTPYSGLGSLSSTGSEQ